MGAGGEKMRIALVASASMLLQGALLGVPKSGDVFREYHWIPQGKYHVLSLEQKPIDLPFDLDLTNAIAAEAVFEIGNAHLGYEDMHVQVNGAAWRRISFPEAERPQPSPSRWYHQWNPVVSIPVSEWKRGAGNRFEMQVGPRTYEGTIPHPAYTCVYGITFRIYYDPAKKVHTSGRMRSPANGAKLGAQVELAVAKTGAIRQVDYIGRYEDLNYEGDGVYHQWHYVFERGRIARHLGSSGTADKTVSWDTSWVPDQVLPMQIAARITDENGLIFVTQPVSRLTLVRPGLSVELAKPYDVPVSFSSCQYGAYVTAGAKSEKFQVKGEPGKAVAARFAISAWNAPSAHGFLVNGTTLENTTLEGFEGNHHLFIVPLTPLGALKAGENTFTLIPGKGRSSDVHWPGVAVLIQYRK